MMKNFHIIPILALIATVSCVRLQPVPEGGGEEKPDLEYSNQIISFGVSATKGAEVVTTPEKVWVTATVANSTVKYMDNICFTRQMTGEDAGLYKSSTPKYWPIDPATKNKLPLRFYVASSDSWMNDNNFILTETTAYRENFSVGRWYAWDHSAGTTTTDAPGASGAVSITLKHPFTKIGNFTINCEGGSHSSVEIVSLKFKPEFGNGTYHFDDNSYEGSAPHEGFFIEDELVSKNIPQGSPSVTEMNQLFFPGKVSISLVWKIHNSLTGYVSEEITSTAQNIEFKAGEYRSLSMNLKDRSFEVVISLEDYSDDGTFDWATDTD